MSQPTAPKTPAPMTAADLLAAIRRGADADAARRAEVSRAAQAAPAWTREDVLAAVRRRHLAWDAEGRPLRPAGR